MAQSDKAKRNFEDIQKSVQETDKFIKEISKEFPDIVNYSKRLVETFSDYKKLSDSQLNTLKKSNDLTQEILGNRRDIHKEDFQIKDLSELEAEFTRKGLQNRKKIIQVLKEEQRIQKSINNQISASANAASKFGDMISNSIKSIPFIGDFLSTALGADNLGQEMSQGVRNQFSGFGRDAGAEFAGSFTSNIFRESGGERGLVSNILLGPKGAKEMSELSKKINEDRKAMGKGEQSPVAQLLSEGQFGLGFLMRNTTRLGILAGVALAGKALSQGLFAYDFENFFKSLLPNFSNFKTIFGDIRQFNLRTVASLTQSRLLYGINGEAALELAKQQRNITGASVEQALAQQRTVAAFARQRGVAPADVIEDLKNNSQLIAEFSRDNFVNLGRAAVEARKLGLSLDTTAKIADSLLDFESSIEAELEAQVLTGKALNLDRARRLVLAGKMGDLQKEIVKQVGSEEALQRMNVMQRRKLAAAIGVSVKELNALAQGKPLEVKSNDTQMNTTAMKFLTNSIKALTLVMGLNVGAQGFRAFQDISRSMGRQATSMSAYRQSGLSFKGVSYQEFVKANRMAGTTPMMLRSGLPKVGLAAGLLGAVDIGTAAMSGQSIAPAVGRTIGGVGGSLAGGAALGFMTGGPIGAMIGALIGGGLGSVVGNSIGGRFDGGEMISEQRKTNEYLNQMVQGVNINEAY